MDNRNRTVKRVMIFIFLLLFLFGGFACDGSETTEFSNEMSDHNIGSTGDVKTCRSEVHPWFNDLFEYLSYVDANEMREDFVHYFQVCFLGWFNYAVIHPNGEYLELKTRSGNFAFKSEAETYASKHPQYESEMPINLYEIDETSSGYYMVGKYRYLYLQGELYTISWETDGRYYRITDVNSVGDSNLFFYLVGRRLTAKMALDCLDWSLSLSSILNKSRAEY